MTDPLRNQLIRTRQEHILAAAAAVFASRGYHATTIRDIARHAGVSDGTIYNYFENKPALLIGIFEQMRAAIITEVPPPAAASPDLNTLLREALLHPLMALRADNFALFRIVMSEMLIDETLRAMYNERILTPTLEQLEPAFIAAAAAYDISSQRAALMLRLLSGMIMGVMLQYTLGDPLLEAAWDSLPGQLADLFLNGLICTPKGDIP